MEARGIEKMTLIEGIEVSIMSQLAQWVAESDKVLAF
jgi:sulfur relay (sulfurtransferase) complex TusBCD TusD component (DsrE family)